MKSSPPLYGVADGLHRFGFAHPLDGDAAEAEAVDLKTGSAQDHALHGGYCNAQVRSIFTMCLASVSAISVCRGTG